MDLDSKTLTGEATKLLNAVEITVMLKTLTFDWSNQINGRSKKVFDLLLKTQIIATSSHDV